MADHKLGGACALLKVHASKTVEFCAREASQIFGGAAVVREGQGKVVERIYREVRAAAIPGSCHGCFALFDLGWPGLV